MDSSMFSDMYKGLTILIVVLMVGAAACGAGILKLSQTYTLNVSVEKKP
jgi:hypothetical protein